MISIGASLINNSQPAGTLRTKPRHLEINLHQIILELPVLQPSQILNGKLVHN
jgi:hypothetical protein